MIQFLPLVLLGSGLLCVETVLILSCSFLDTPIDNHGDFQSSMVFTYDLAIGLEIMLAENFTSYLGYRLIGLTDNKDFEGSFQHLFELGVGANF